MGGDVANVGGYIDGFGRDTLIIKGTRNMTRKSSRVALEVADNIHEETCVRMCTCGFMHSRPLTLVQKDASDGKIFESHHSYIGEALVQARSPCRGGLYVMGRAQLEALNTRYLLI